MTKFTDQIKQAPLTDTELQMLKEADEVGEKFTNWLNLPSSSVLREAYEKAEAEFQAKWDCNYKLKQAERER